MVATSIGSYEIPLLQIMLGDAQLLQQIVLIEIRLPRVILSALVGAGLGVAGASLQGLFRNPLADPGLIGVSAGAALGAALFIVVGSGVTTGFIAGVFLLPIAAILGASFVIIMLYLLTQGFGHQGVTYMLLVGIAVNAIASVAIGILTFVSTDAELRGLMVWTMGSFGGVTWPVLLPAIFIILIAIFYLLPSARQLDIIQLGEPEAYRLGVNIKKLKYRIIFSSATAVGASVALSGMIGFVGLVVPHLARLIGGVNHNYLLPASALMGASLMITADLISRLVIQPAELPVGLITSALGSPFFLWLIFRLRRP